MWEWVVKKQDSWNGRVRCFRREGGREGAKLTVCTVLESMTQLQNWIILDNRTKALAPTPSEWRCQRSLTSSISRHWSLRWRWGFFPPSSKALTDQLLYSILVSYTRTFFTTWYVVDSIYYTVYFIFRDWTMGLCNRQVRMKDAKTNCIAWKIRVQSQFLLFDIFPNPFVVSCKWVFMGGNNFVLNSTLVSQYSDRTPSQLSIWCFSPKTLSVLSTEILDCLMAETIFVIKRLTIPVINNAV